MDTLLSGWGAHLAIFFAGASGLSLIGHMVNTFPVPKNAYGAWLLGVFQYAVGQRVAAANTFKGLDTVATAVKQP